VQGRQKTVTDGPFAEAKDVVGGYTLIEAQDLSEAVELSKGDIPAFLKRTETQEQAARRRKKYATKDTTGVLKTMMRPIDALLATVVGLILATFVLAFTTGVIALP